MEACDVTQPTSEADVLGELQLEDVIFQALTMEVSDTAYLQRLSKKAAVAVMAHINELAERAMAKATEALGKHGTAGTVSPQPHEHLNTLLDTVLDRSAQDQWFATPIPRLGGRTPMQAINDGDYDAVVEVAESYSEPQAYT